MSAIILIDGKPHRYCECDGLSSKCARGLERTMHTCGFARCLVPAPDAVLTVGDFSPYDRRP